MNGAIDRRRPRSQPILPPASHCLGLLCVYAFCLLLIVVLYPAASGGMAVLPGVVAAVTAWLLGWRAGLLAGVGHAALAITLLSWLIESRLSVTAFQIGFISIFTILLGGSAASWLRWHLKQAREQAAELMHVRAELHALTSNRAHAERARADGEARFRSLIHDLHVGVLLQGPRAEILFSNPAALDLLGLTEDQLLGKTSFDPDWHVIHIDGSPFPGDTHPVPIAIATRRPVRNIVMGVYHPARHDRVWLQVDAQPQLAEDGSVYQVICTFSDITKRQQAEEARHLLERKMLETQKLESLGVLAGGIAHDFNNLLMAILGNADMAMLDLSAHDPMRESLGQIQVAAKRAAELTSQMLAYAGKGRFLIERIDLNLLVEEITVLLMVSIPKTTLLRYNLSANLPLAEGDAAQLRQVVMNLVINAAEAIGTREGLITISTGVRHVDSAYLQTARLASDLPAGYYLYLEVNDTGVGMDEATLAKIFDPFFTTKFTGRGLGLAAVAGIVRGHCGAVEVQSRPGQGTIFTVLLPAVDVADSVPSLPTEVMLAPEMPVKAGDCPIVLLADDETGVRGVTTSLLERHGFQVLSAAYGRQALDLFVQHADQVAVALLDLSMPQLNGEEVLQALRSIRPDLPALIMSGYDERELSQRFAGVEAVGFLQKPFLAQALYASVEQALAGAS